MKLCVPQYKHVAELASTKTSRKFIQQQTSAKGGWFAVLWMAAAVAAGAAACPSQTKKVLASVTIPHFNFALYGEMRPK